MDEWTNTEINTVLYLEVWLLVYIKFYQNFNPYEHLDSFDFWAYGGGTILKLEIII